MGTTSAVNLKRLSRIELDTIFKDGHCPKATDLLAVNMSVDRWSEWRVDMLTGLIPNMGGWPMRHRKQFYVSSEASIVGCNMLFCDWHWGWFILNDRLGLPVDLEYLLIDYDCPENGDLVRNRILDRVRTTNDPNVLLGRFYLVWRGKPRFVGYFSLTRNLEFAA